MHHILKQLAGGHPPEVTPDALERLRSYQWPGNVRQLRNCLERAVLLSNDNRITLSELPPEVARPAAAPVMFAQQPGAAAGADSSNVAGQAAFNAASSSPASLREVERQQILAA